MLGNGIVLNQKNLVQELLDWWDQGHRDLPWRRTEDPYAIWVAEVMLQQTQVATVLPYFERWMARFPTVDVLAQASLDDVLVIWQGLGYYSRARNLLAAARIVVARHNGRLPEETSTLMELPGIGRYTAGAIASIAFDQAVPVLDGNVIRVLSRLTDLEDDISLDATRRELWNLAASLVPNNRPGDYNQALMELGQLVCLSTAPLCGSCPISNYCLAKMRGRQLERPVRAPRNRTPHYDVVAGVIWRSEPSVDKEFLIARRPLNGMLGGLWEFPGGKVQGNENHHQALEREIAEELAIDIQIAKHLCSFKHTYTHFRITLHTYYAWHISGEPQHLAVADHAWVKLHDVNRFAFAATDQQIINILKQDLSESDQI